jgi:hypothetical protein
MRFIIKTITALMLISCVNNSTAQDTTKTDKKIKECVLSVANLAPLNISIKYKKQLKHNTFFKIGLVNLNANSTQNDPGQSINLGNSSSYFSAGVGGGLEFRKNVTNDLTFFHGPGISTTYNINYLRIKNPSLPPELQRSVNQGYTMRMDYSLGLLFHLKNHFFMAAELTPGLSCSWDKNTSPGSLVNKRFSTGFGFGNSYGLLSLVYRL